MTNNFNIPSPAETGYFAQQDIALLVHYIAEKLKNDIFEFDYPVRRDIRLPFYTMPAVKTIFRKYGWDVEDVVYGTKEESKTVLKLTPTNVATSNKNYNDRNTYYLDR